ncbi:hypothetical protein [Ramlibacter sp. WS9]|uniref:hypothetical protein n=1 Tax=Ramlibacter sp. WS9 TaxID=1882741 RepID=UPI0011444671|nr:hypothetical protein [Ramlibacter sp. WS9]ROZ76656.1 hypothetical protein EEB15_12495 [Ramlibacter sp. WS9]
MNKLSPLSRFAACLLVLAASGAHAQSSCDSDKQPRPVALLERFISADCESCWADPATPRAGRGELAVDWIVPGGKGDDAPLSAAASRDSLARLEALQRAAPAQADATKHRIAANGRQLRVAHGLAFNGYVGASIELKPGARGPWRAWLLLVETVPAGTEGSPVERNLVRNVLQTAWDGAGSLSKPEQLRLFESRPMSIPEGANPQRLRVIGVLEDARGHVVAAAVSRCTAAGR